MTASRDSLRAIADDMHNAIKALAAAVQQLEAQLVADPVAGKDWLPQDLPERDEFGHGIRGAR
jgi:hypothetical protein